MKLRHPLLIRTVAFFASHAIRLWMRTVRYRLDMEARVHPYRRTGKENFIYAFWHETMLCPAGRAWPGRFYVLISQSADGELIAQVCHWLGFRTVRGSSSRGGVAAVRGMMREKDNGDLFVTPDGPRGPRRRVQPGLIYLAAKTGLPIVPMAVGYAKAWRARSWDRFAVPWPGSKLVCVSGKLIQVPAEINKEQMEQYRTEVENAFVQLTERTEQDTYRARRPFAA